MTINRYNDDKSSATGLLPQAEVEDRKNVSTVKPTDYPKGDRDDGAVTGADNRGRRASKGSGPVSGSGAGAGGKGNPEDYDSDAPAGRGTAGMRTDDGPKTGADAPSGGSR